MDSGVIIMEKEKRGLRAYFCSLKRYEKLLLFVNVFVLAATLFYQMTAANLYVDSDVAASMLYAEEINRTGSLLPSEWNTNHDVGPFGIGTIAALMLNFTDSWLTAHAASVAVLILAAAFSIIFMSVKVFRSNMWLVALPMLLCGISYDYDKFVFSDGAYIFPMIYEFLALTFFLKGLDENYCIGSKRWFAAFMIMTVFTGSYGIRYVQALEIPILVSLVLYYFFLHCRENDFKFTRENSRPLTTILMVLIACAAGFLLFKLLTMRFTFHEGYATLHFSKDVEEMVGGLFTLVCQTARLFSFDYAGSMMSAEGLITIVRIFFEIILLIVLPILEIRRFREERPEIRFLIMFALISLLETSAQVALTGFGGTLSGRYLLPAEYVLIMLSAHYAWEHIFCIPNIMTRFVSMLAVAALAFQPAVKKSMSLVGYEDELAALSETALFLEKNDLTYGYATYWNAAIQTMLTDGAVRVNAVEWESDSYERIQGQYWLNSSYYYSEDYHDSGSFLMLEPKENRLFQRSDSYELLGEPQDILYFKDLIIYIYDYNIAVNEFSGR